MKEEILPIILVIVAIGGIVLTNEASGLLVPEMIDISEIDLNMRGKLVLTRGIITEIRVFSAGCYLLLSDNKRNIEVIYFDRIPFKAKKGMCAQVLGEIVSVKGGLEIDAKDVFSYVC